MRMHARLCLVLSIVLLVAGLPGLAAPEGPSWVSAPSGQTVGQMAEVFGGGFAGGSVVTVKLTDPAGVQYTDAVTVAKDGSISVTIELGAAGYYRAEVFNKRGVRLAWTLFPAAPRPSR